jgi:acyl-coenzyme A thioesterase PaaI-like protein
MTVGVRPVAFRLDAGALARAQALFNQRGEIAWFGFRGAFEAECAVIRFAELHRGLQGGGGSEAINGGVVAAGFDAAVVLAGLGHYDTNTVVTVDLSIQFLALARPAPDLAWRAWATRTTRGLCFVQGMLGAQEAVFASATAIVKPVSTAATAG